MHISPRISKNGRAVSCGQSSANSSGRKPCLVGSTSMFTSNKMRAVHPGSPAMREMVSAKPRLSTASMSSSPCSAAYRTFLR